MRLSWCVSGIWGWEVFTTAHKVILAATSPSQMGNIAFILRGAAPQIWISQKWCVTHLGAKNPRLGWDIRRRLLVEWAVVVLSSGQHEQEHHQVQHCQQGHHHHQCVLCVRHSPIQGDRRDLWHDLHHHHPHKVRSAPAVTKLNGQLGIAPISRNHSQAVGQKFLRSTQKFIFEEYTEFSFWGTHRNVALKYIFQWPPSILRTTRWKNSWQWFKKYSTDILKLHNCIYWK